MAMKKIWIALVVIIVIAAYVVLDFFGVISNINSQFSKKSFDKSCNSDPDCKVISYRCPGGGCGHCDDVICAKGKWEDRFCPLPNVLPSFVACFPCAPPTFECKCINNVCEKFQK